MSIDSLVLPFPCPQNKIYKNHPLSFPKGEQDLLGAYHLVSLAIKKFSPNYGDSTSFPRLPHGMVIFYGHVSKSIIFRLNISALEIRVLKVLHIGVFKKIKLLFSNYVLSITFPLLYLFYKILRLSKVGRYSKFGSTLICLQYFLVTKVLFSSKMWAIAIMLYACARLRGIQ